MTKEQDFAFDLQLFAGGQGQTQAREKQRAAHRRAVQGQTRAAQAQWAVQEHRRAQEKRRAARS